MKQLNFFSLCLSNASFSSFLAFPCVSQSKRPASDPGGQVRTWSDAVGVGARGWSCLWSSIALSICAFLLLLSAAGNFVKLKRKLKEKPNGQRLKEEHKVNSKHVNEVNVFTCVCVVFNVSSPSTRIIYLHYWYLQGSKNNVPWYVPGMEGRSSNWIIQLRAKEEMTEEVEMRWWWRRTVTPATLQPQRTGNIWVTGWGGCMVCRPRDMLTAIDTFYTIELYIEIKIEMNETFL